MTEIAYIGLGSNLGERRDNLESARRFIANEIGKISAESSIYETEAIGPEQPMFLNQVIKVESNLFPRDLLKALLGIEKRMGRKRKEKWGPRLIDLDILFYGDKIISENDLKVPHPELHHRMFVLVPMAEINNDFIHPGLNTKISDLKDRCHDTSSIRLYNG